MTDTQPCTKHPGPPIGAIELTDSHYETIRSRRPADFVIGVLTTGICCRSGCPARTPRRENIRLYRDVVQARLAGFRDCLRCRPGGDEPHLRAMIDLARTLAAHPFDVDIARIAASERCSDVVLRRRFRAVFGVTPKQYQAGLRQHRYRALLRAGQRVTRAVQDAGYGSPARAHEQAGLGMPASRYRDGGAGERIDWTCGRTPLGWLLLAATDRGVCCVQFGDSEPALAAALAEEFPAAQRQRVEPRSAPALIEWWAALERHLTADGPRPDLPLDLRGTAFQMAVWRYLMTLEQGATASYCDVARGVGRPRAVRAAAGACAANRLAVLIPCHRVLRADGGLGGYRWGEDRKRRLLQREGAID